MLNWIAAGLVLLVKAYQMFFIDKLYLTLPEDEEIQVSWKLKKKGRGIKFPKYEYYTREVILSSRHVKYINLHYVVVVILVTLLFEWEVVPRSQACFPLDALQQ